MLPVKLSVLLSFFLTAACAQPLSIVFKRHDRIISRFWTGSVLTFQLENGNWEKGEIVQIRPDSFYLRPYTVKFSMTGPDTSYFGIDGYSLMDVYALPKKGYQIEYFDGGWNVYRAGGHVHWYWVKSGWIFRVLGVGYIGLQTLNGLIKQDFSLSSNLGGFGIGAAVALGGVALKKAYKITHRIGKTYRLSIY